MSDDHGFQPAVLRDVTNVEATPQQKGWHPKIPLNYDVYNADTREKVEAAQARGVTFTSWAANAARYVYDDEYGEIGPRDEELEKELFDVDLMCELGEHYAVLDSIPVTVEGPRNIKPIKNFKEAGLHPSMLENVKNCRYSVPTPIQAFCIPSLLLGYDVIGIAQTGSGKTAAYLLPILSKLMGKAKKLAAPRPNPARYREETDAVTAEPLVIIICPTRELAIQIFDDARRLCYRTMLRPCAVYGGSPTQDQIKELHRGCDVLIATPGRLKDFMGRPSILKLTRLKFTVLDEADDMLTGNFEDDLKDIFMSGATAMDGDHQFMMFSATFPKELRALARNYLTDEYIRIKVGRIGSAHSNVHQQVIWVEEGLKKQAINDLLLSSPPCRTMIFVNSISKCDIVDDFLFNLEFPVTSIHSKRTQKEREDAIRAFRQGTCPVLVTTSVAARGLDIKNVMHVVNYDLPSTNHGGIDEYIHRIGRTARIGNRGQASSFYNGGNEDIADALTKTLVECNQELPDFLEPYKPAEGQPITWDDDTESEEEDGGVQTGEDVAVLSDDGQNDQW